MTRTRTRVRGGALRAGDGHHPRNRRHGRRDSDLPRPGDGDRHAGAGAGCQRHTEDGDGAESNEKEGTARGCMAVCPEGVPEPVPASTISKVAETPANTGRPADTLTPEAIGANLARKGVRVERPVPRTLPPAGRTAITAFLGTPGAPRVSGHRRRRPDHTGSALAARDERTLTGPRLFSCPGGSRATGGWRGAGWPWRRDGRRRRRQRAPFPWRVGDCRCIVRAQASRTRTGRIRSRPVRGYLVQE